MPQFEIGVSKIEIGTHVVAIDPQRLQVGFVCIGETFQAEQTVSKHIPQPGTVTRIQLKCGSDQLQSCLEIPELQANEFSHLTNQVPIAGVPFQSNAKALKGFIVAASRGVPPTLLGGRFEIRKSIATKPLHE